jgi:hypothetical protein
MKFSILSMFQYFTVQIVSSFYDKQMKSYFFQKKKPLHTCNGFFNFTSF